MSRGAAAGDLPVPADFGVAPTPADLGRWEEADRAARPARLARLRARFATAGVDAYFGVRREHMRYLTGFTLGEGEEKVAGNSGQFLVGAEDVAVLADSRYTIQVRREAPEARLVESYNDLPARWPDLLASAGARRVAVEAGFVSHATWEKLAAAAPDVELVAVEGWLEADRAVKEPAEIERIAAACAVADRALAALLPEILPGVTEAQLALRLEWLMRTGGAEALAFDVACLAGPEAALPHGAPGDRPVRAESVLLFDFGAQVAGYRSDMTRTLFVGEPSARDLDVYDLVARAQSAAIEAVEGAVARVAGGDGDAAGRPGHRCDRTRRHRGRRPRRAFRPRDRARDRTGDARGTVARATRAGDAAAQPDGLLGRARRLPRGRDGRADRGSRRRRCRRRPGRAPDPVPARCHGRRRLTVSTGGRFAVVAALLVALGVIAGCGAAAPSGPAPSPRVTCVGIPPEKCDEAVASVMRSLLDASPEAIDVTCVSSGCTSSAGSMDTVVTLSGGRQLHANPLTWGNGGGPQLPPVVPGMPPLPVAPICLGIPDEMCRQMAGSEFPRSGAPRWCREDRRELHEEAMHEPEGRRDHRRSRSATGRRTAAAAGATRTPPGADGAGATGPSDTIGPSIHHPTPPVRASCCGTTHPRARPGAPSA